MWNTEITYLLNFITRLTSSIWNIVSYNAIWGSGATEDYMVRSRCSSSSWHLFKNDFFSWISHVFISCLWPRFHFTITLSASWLSYLVEHRGEYGRRMEWGVHIKLNDTETIHPAWKRNGGICWWRKGWEVMEGWYKKKLKLGGVWCDGTAASWSPGQLLNSKSTHLITTCQGCE